MMDLIENIFQHLLAVHAKSIQAVEIGAAGRIDERTG